MALSETGIVIKILKLTKTIGADWEDALYEMGIYEYFKDIYTTNNDPLISNTLVAFIILSYSNESDWIVVGHNRARNKRDNLLRLGLSEKEVKKKFWTEVINRGNPIVNNIAKWFLDWQKDSRWSTFITKKEYYAENIQFVNTPLSLTKQVVYRGDITEIALSDEEILKAKTLKGKLLTEAQEQEQTALALHKEMEKDFATLDAILNKEEVPTLTDKKNISYESMIEKRNSQDS